MVGGGVAGVGAEVEAFGVYGAVLLHSHGAGRWFGAACESLVGSPP